MNTKLKHTLLAVSLAGALSVTLSACTPHERLHSGLNAEHEAFHQQPRTRAEDRRFHDELGAVHEEEHERGSYGGRYYDGY